MKIRTILSGITALLLVGTFYSFAFCMVEDVDDEPISMDYYYSTETDAATGEQLGEATSAAVTEAEETAKVQAAKAMPVQDPEKSAVAEQIEEKIMSLPSGSEASAYGMAENEEDAEDEVVPEDDGELASNENSANGNDDVLADDKASDKLLSKLDSEIPEEEDEPVVTTVPEDDIDDDDLYTYIIENPEEEEEPDLSDIPPVPESDVIITIDTTTYTETTVTTVVTPGNDISTDEMLTAKYNGSVHTVDAFELVCMIVNNEISSYFNDEAIKAQAVAAYSYVKYHNVNGLTPSVLVKSNPPQRIVDMVASVWGKCCYYNGEVAQTVYMASSSGYTASSENVWGGKIPYLTSVACPFDSESDPNYGVKTKFSEAAIRSAVEKYLGITLSDDPENWFTITEYVDGNYVSKVNVDGQITITGRKLRESILNYQLKSASFDISYSSDGYFIFTTYGWGHGVGMSQNGANILAKKGYTYDQILKYYYTGIDVL
ncbi:MAG: SpoIID/LytB domain-containing protein [Oscillospiraceae bacterium]